jgi:GGDEF domain-containing protein
VGNGKRWFWVGSNPAVREALTAALAAPPTTAALADAGAGDLVVVDALATGEDVARLPTGHVFGGVRALKDKKGLAVHVVVDGHDRFGMQLARFAMADGVLPWHAATTSLDTRELTPAATATRRAPLDALLARLQGPSGTLPETSLQRLLRFEREDTLVNRLQDVETGLFDGPYATLKLDEEWKRAHRFHQPLSLLLVDLGARIATLGAQERRLVFAEAAGVFLNECRDIDVLARFAPTVFLFLLPGTGPDGAEVLAGRILTALRERFATRSDVRPVCGVCSVPSSEVPDRRAFLAIAEACLARAEAQGPGTVSTTWQ